mgnify:CR=1 FL=1
MDRIYKYPAVGLLCLAALLCGCATKRASNESRHLTASLFTTDRDFAAYAKQHGVANAFREFAAPNAISFPMGEAPLHGREAIYQTMLNFPKGELLWEPAGSDIARSGELGYTWGTYEFRTTDAEGKAVTHHGKYVTVWKKQQDGRWKFVADIGNSGPAPQP